MRTLCRWLLASVLAAGGWAQAGENEAVLPASLGELLAKLPPALVRGPASPLGEQLRELGVAAEAIDRANAVCRGAYVGAPGDLAAAPTPGRLAVSSIFEALAAIADIDEREAIANEWVAITYGRYQRAQASSQGQAVPVRETEADYRQKLAERNQLRLQQRQLRERLSRLTGLEIGLFGDDFAADIDAIDAIDPNESLPVVSLAAHPALARLQAARPGTSADSDCQRWWSQLAALAERQISERTSNFRNEWELIGTTQLPLAEARRSLAEQRLAAARDAHDQGARPSTLGWRSTEYAEALRALRAVHAARYLARLRYLEAAGKSPGAVAD